MGVYLIMFPKVDHQHLSFTDIERQVVVQAPLSQKPQLFSVSCLVIIGDQTHNGGIVSKFNNGIGAVNSHTIMCKQGLQHRAQCASMWRASVEGQ